MAMTVDLSKSPFSAMKQSSLIHLSVLTAVVENGEVKEPRSSHHRQRPVRDFESSTAQ
jgi:hypothetical protein